MHPARGVTYANWLGANLGADCPTTPRDMIAIWEGRTARVRQLHISMQLKDTAGRANWENAAPPTKTNATIATRKSLVIVPSAGDVSKQR
jgi:hypothetical protein